MQTTVPSRHSCRAESSLVFQHYELYIQPPHFPFLITRKGCFAFCFVLFCAVCFCPTQLHGHECFSAPARSPAKALQTDTASLGSVCGGCHRDTSPALLTPRHSTQQPCLCWWPCCRAPFVASQMAPRSSQITAWVKMEHHLVALWPRHYFWEREMAIYPFTLHPVPP